MRAVGTAARIIATNQHLPSRANRRKSTQLVSTMAALSSSLERPLSMAEKLQARVDACNTITPEEAKESYVPFVVNGDAVGALQPWFARALVDACGPKTLVWDDEASATSGKVTGTVRFADGLDTTDKRSEALAPGLRKLSDDGIITGWRNEIFPVTTGYGVVPSVRIERAAASLLGVRAYGVHVNGYVTLSDGSHELWVGKRASNKQTFPSKLDHLVAGGLPDGLPPSECVVKECAEEASVPRALAERAKSVGVVSYAMN